ncbi:DEAD/DEAH box helicase [Candidatus Micrarchaeota archaeon]|nr:DEAD/DEAH box helicase [Candidatus Micrarchaeota archaeon]
MDSLDLTLLKRDKAELRDYQVIAAENCLKHNALVVFPTAMGKTFVAILVIAHLLNQKKKSLFLAPTKPLAMQQADRLKDVLEINPEAVQVVTGEIQPEKRIELYNNSWVIVGTPQTIEHDVLSGKIKLTDYSLIVFDEAHRTVGDYAYAFIAKQALAKKIKVIGLTASPSSQTEKIMEVCNNLGINHLEVKTEKDAAEYSNKVTINNEYVDLPEEFKEVRTLLEEILKETLSILKENGFLDSAALTTHKGKLLALRGKIILATKHDPRAYQALSSLAKALNLVQAIDLLESQGLQSLNEFLSSLKDRKTKTKAVQQLIDDFRIKKIQTITSTMLEKNIEHPKLEKLKEIISNSTKSGQSVIVFAHYRNSVDSLQKELNKLPGVDARIIVGRSNEGMSQKKQKEALDSFRNKEFNVLVSTSVGEEGLDVPAVDLVVFYEAVPSEIRLIQRRGRAGRTRVGNAIILVTKDTKDEAFMWISKRKEKKMHETLKSIQNIISEAPQKKLGEY